jgi:hypothetical protein
VSFHQADQQCSVGVVLLELVPANVARVMIAQQDVPRLHRLVVSGSLSRSSVYDPCSIAPAPEDIGACVDRMLQNGKHLMIGRRLQLDMVGTGALLQLNVAPLNKKTCIGG